MTEPQLASAPQPVAARHERLVDGLRRLFAELFQVPVAEVPAEATFLELGADSLFMLRASHQLQMRFGAHVPFRRLIEDLGSVALLASHLASQREPEALAPAPAPSAPEGDLPAPPPANGGASGVAATADSAWPAVQPAGRTAELAAVFAEQLRLMERQLDLLARDRPAGAAASRPAQAPAVTAATAESESRAAAPTSGRPAHREGAPAAAASAYIPFQPLDRSRGAQLTAGQRAHLEQLIARLGKKTGGSKQLAATYRQVLANSRSTTGFRLLWKELVYPLVARRADGAYLWDVDGNRYVDLTMGYGTLLFGHSPAFLREAMQRQLDLGLRVGPETEPTGEVAAMISAATGCERVTFAGSGTEAVMAALRLARTRTGRSRFAIYSGSYHGTYDALLARGARASDGRLAPVPVAPGIPQRLIDDVLVLDYDGLGSLPIVEEHAAELAAVLVEPVQSRRPGRENRELLARLRALTRQAGVALIFDEVVTGFRLHAGGVQALFDVQADIAVYGKAVANGLPIGVIAGRREFLDTVDGGDWRFGDDSMPEADTTLFTGTFFRHPWTMAAAKAVLQQLAARSGLQRELGEATAWLATTLNRQLEQAGLPLRVEHFGSLFTFVATAPWPWTDLLFFHLLERGIYIWERRVCYLSTAHTREDLEQVAAAVDASLCEMADGGFLPETAGARPAPRSSSSRPELPLTDDQRDLLDLTRLGDSASRALNISLAMRLGGPFSASAMRRSLQRLADRHEALRIRFASHEVQLVAAHATVPLPLVDLSATATDGRELLAAAAAHPFDLARGPLLRCLLLRLAPERHVLSLNVHHLAVDGVSLATMVRELAQIYPAEATGAVRLLPTQGSYSRFVTELSRQERSAAEASEHAAFWQRCYTPPPPFLELPLDRPRPAVRTFAAEHATHPLTPGLSTAVRAAGAGVGATTYVFMLAAIATLLGKLSGQDDLVIAVPTDRHLQDGGPLLGYFVKLLPLRCRLPGAAGFASLVGSVRRDLLSAFEHRDYPLSRLMQRLGVADKTRPPLAAVMFTLDRRTRVDIPGLEVDVAVVPPGTEEFELVWAIEESADRFVVGCSWNRDLFSRASIERWQRLLAALLARVAADPETRLRDLGRETPRENPGEAGATL
jgi:glutamate-1-semialdehyde aminotransferase/aryl carrier-like protein